MSIAELCSFLYGKRAVQAMAAIDAVMARRLPRLAAAQAIRTTRDSGTEAGLQGLDCGSAMLITYAHSIAGQGTAPPLRSLRDFVSDHLDGCFSHIHLLPFFPYSSDDGFSVIDYRQVDPEHGGWQDVAALRSEASLAFDLVLNHASSRSAWFQSFLAADQAYADWFVTRPEGYDSSLVVRPRTHPLLTAYELADGSRRQVWTTFSADQVDLNFAEPAVLAEMLDILLDYIERGARIIRLDAIAYLWKEDGHSCLHHPKTHAVVRLFRAVLDSYGIDCLLLTETNVPHAENISYFGQGDEAHMVYNFALPPLVLHSFVSGQAAELSAWAAGLDLRAGTAYLNFLASHDGVGLTPVASLVEEKAFDATIEELKRRGGLISWKATPGGQIPYELNIGWFDAVAAPELAKRERIQAQLASYAIACFLDGLPAIYIHSLLATPNWTDGPRLRGYNRAINRRQLSVDELASGLADASSALRLCLDGFKALLSARRDEPAFAPGSPCRVLTLAPELFCIVRGPRDGRSLLCIVNVSAKPLVLRLPPSVEAIGPFFRPVAGGVPVAGTSSAGTAGGSTAGQIELSTYDLGWLPVRLLG